MKLKPPPIPSEVWATVVKRTSKSTLSSSSWFPAPAPAPALPVANNTSNNEWSIDPKTKSVLVSIDNNTSPTLDVVDEEEDDLMGDTDSIFDDISTSMSTTTI